MATHEREHILSVVLSLLFLWRVSHEDSPERATLTVTEGAWVRKAYASHQAQHPLKSQELGDSKLCPVSGAATNLEVIPQSGK